jgi:hypothetical protein
MELDGDRHMEKKLKRVVMEEENRKLVIEHNKEGDLIIRFYEEDYNEI